MSNVRQLLLIAESAAITVEKSKAAVETARAELEAAKRVVDDAKSALDDAYVRLEEAGIPKAKARKAVEDIIGALALIGIEIGTVDAVPVAASAEPRQPVQRQPRRKRDANTETTEAEGSASAGNASSAEVLPVEPIVSPADEVAVHAASEVAAPAQAHPASTEAIEDEAEENTASEAAPAEVTASLDDDLQDDRIDDYAGKISDLDAGAEILTEDEIPDHVDLFGEASPAAAEEQPIENRVEPTSPAPVVESVAPPPVTAAENAPSPGFRRPSFLGRKA